MLLTDAAWPPDARLPPDLFSTQGVSAMPSYVPSPLTDVPAFNPGVAPAADGEAPMVGYECAMPWFHVAAAPAADPVYTPGPENPAA